MDIRRVQITGGSSYTISLPKEWIRTQSIEKNSPVGLSIQPDGTLLVYPRVDGGRIEKEKVFDLDKFEGRITFRLLIGAYVMGYSCIRISSKDPIPDEVLEAAMEFTQKAIGPEILEETERSIVIKDLLNPTKMPFEKTLDRMYILVRYMHLDAGTSLVNFDHSISKEVAQRDIEVDRLNWLMAHQYNIINRSSLSHKLDISREDSEFYFVTGKIVERIGDHAVQIAKGSINLDEKVPAELRETITEAINRSVNIFDRAINSWHHKDLEAANRNIDEVGALHDLCDKIENRPMDREDERALCIGRIVDSIRRTGEYSTDISENVINYLVNQV